MNDSRIKIALRELHFQLRYALPVWLLWILTGWWPSNRVTIKIRGRLHRPFFKKCGKNLQMANGVMLLNPHNIEIGDDVYLAYYVWLNGLGGIVIEDEVVLGPYVTISSLTHCCRDGSFRFGGAKAAPVRIGRGSWLAAHCSVAAGVTVSAGCLVAANSAVVRDLPAGSICGGVPAQVVGECKDQEPDMMSRSGWKSGA